MTETTPPEDSPPTAECRQCADPVLIRRPSLTGAHFCTKKSCQAAKQRFYYRRRASGVAEAERHQAAIRDDLIIAIIAGAADPRVSCSECGRPDTLPDFGHPDADWTAPCPGGGKAPFPSGLGGRIAQTLWPPT